MRSSNDANFRISEGMILVAGVGLGLALCRFTEVEELWAIILEGWSRNREKNDLIFRAAGRTLGCIAIPMGLLLGTYSLCWRRDIASPGRLAHFALPVAACLKFVFGWPGYLLRGNIKLHLAHNFLADVTRLQWNAVVVGLVWSLQTVIREWRPDPRWDDRLGRVIGVTFIAFGIIEMLSRCYRAFE